MSKLLQDTGEYLHGGLQAGKLRGRGQGHQTARRADRHVSPDKSVLLFCQSLKGCQTAIGKMTRRADLRIEDNAVLRKYLRGLAVVGHEPPSECDSMDSEHRDLYHDYKKYQESAGPAAYAHHATFSTNDALYAAILAIHTR